MRRRNPPIDFDRRWAREEQRAHPGRTWEQARELWAQAAKSAQICGGCFRPLAPADSVTMGWRKIGKHYWVRVPICLLCALDAIKKSFFERRYQRARCRNCGRPLRLHRPSRIDSWFSLFGIRLPWSPSLNRQTCCADCERLAKNQRNKLRRRVRHQPVSCIKCGRSFTPKRDDAQCCSNKCRQALHRERQRAELGGGNHPLRKAGGSVHTGGAR